MTVTFAEIACAPAGMPQEPVATKRRTDEAASRGPPSGPFGLRVSRTRQGVTSKKPVVEDPPTVVDANTPWLAFPYEPLALVSTFTARTMYVQPPPGTPESVNDVIPSGEEVTREKGPPGFGDR